MMSAFNDRGREAWDHTRHIMAFVHNAGAAAAGANKDDLKRPTDIMELESDRPKRKETHKERLDKFKEHLKQLGYPWPPGTS